MKLVCNCETSKIVSPQASNNRMRYLKVSRPWAVNPSCFMRLRRSGIRRPGKGCVNVLVQVPANALHMEECIVKQDVVQEE